MKRIVLAFVLGAAVAAGVVLFVVKRESAPPQPAPVASTSTPAAPAPEAAPPQPVPIAIPAQPVKPAPSRTSRLSQRQASSRTEAEAPAAPTAPAPSAPQAAPPAQPATPAPVVARQEQPVAPPPPPPEPKRVTLTAGTLLSVRLMEALSSDRVQAGDSFSASLDQPVVVDGYVIAERGARVSGKVISAEKAGRVKGLAQLSVELTQFTTSDGQKIHIQTDPFVREGPKSTKSDAAKVGAGAGIGAIIGAIAGGGKGAAIGAGVGGAAGTGTVMATRGKPAVLPVETRLSFRLKEPVTVTEKLR
ncbi:MAG: hypothetical protein LLG20_15140 [Acidobacteriales bacterium]|nr:hypothetical protein [Terriglobales bacterium]